MMRPNVWQRLDLLARNLTPFGLSLLLLIAGLTPLHIPELARISPLLVLAAVYHWAVYRPGLLPPSAVFLLGLLQDVLGGLPLGISAVVFLSVHGLVVWQNRFLAGKSFLIVWLGFALILAGADMLTWVLSSIFHATLVSGEAMLYQYLVTLGLFPPLSWLLVGWQRAILRTEAE